MSSGFQASVQFFAIRVGIAVCMTTLLYAFLAFTFRPSAEQRSIVVYSYSDMLSSDDFEQFEKETGIEVIVRHFETVEEIMTKLSFAKEGDIDIVAPTDAMIETLIGEGLLSPLQRDQLPSYRHLDTRLLGRFYDPKNQYSVPFSWSPVGIVYDARALSLPPEKIGWDLIFGRVIDDEFVQSPRQVYGEGIGRVCLGEDPLEVYFLAALHLFGSFEHVTQEQEQHIVALLRAQKSWLECYTNNMKYFLIAGVTHAAVAPAAYFVQMQREHEWVRFAVPSQGSMVLIGNVAISARSEKKDLALKAIEFLISVRGGLECFRTHAYNPANKKAYCYLPAKVRANRYIFPDGQLFDRLGTFHNKVPLQRIERAWHNIKL